MARILLIGGPSHGRTLTMEDGDNPPRSFYYTAIRVGRDNYAKYAYVGKTYVMNNGIHTRIGTYLDDDETLYMMQGLEQTGQLPTLEQLQRAKENWK